MHRFVRMGMTLAAAAALASCAKKKSADDEPTPDPKVIEGTQPTDPVKQPATADAATPIPGAAMTLGSAHYRLREPLETPRFDGDGRLLGAIGEHLVAVDTTTGAISEVAQFDDVGAIDVLGDGSLIVGGEGVSFADRAGKVSRAFPIDAGTITSIAASADGKELALSGHQGAILVVDAASGKELARIPSGAEGHEAVTFGGNGTRLVARRGESVVVLERATGKELVKVPAPQGVWALGGTQLATVAGGNPIDGYDVDVFDAETGAVVVGIHRERAVRALAWMPDGATLVIGDEAGTIEKFKVAGRAATAAGPAVTVHGGAIHTLAISPSGTKLAAITETGAIRFLDAAADAVPDPGPGHLGAVERLAFSGDFLISGGNDRTIWTWELAGSRRQAKIELAGDLKAMTPAPDDQGVYAQVDVYTRPYETAYALTQHRIEGYTLSGARKFSEVLAQGADSLKYCGYRKAIQVISGSHWKEIDPSSFDVTERGRSTGARGRLGPNGGFAAFEGHGALIVLDDAATHRLGTAGCSLVKGVAFDQAGEVVAMTDGTNAMRLWRTDGTLLGGVAVKDAGFAHDGVVLPDHVTALFTMYDGLLLWDQAKGTAGKIALDNPTALAVTPAGDRLAVGFKNGQIGIFDLATLRGTMTPLETSAAPELTDDDCHQLRPEHYEEAPAAPRRFGEPRTPEKKVDPGTVPAVDRPPHR